MEKVICGAGVLWMSSAGPVFVMECYDKIEPERRSFMRRMKRHWDEKGLFEVSAQRLLDQVRVIKTNDYLSKVQL